MRRLELISDDTFVIRGRGKVFSFSANKLPETVMHPGEFMNCGVIIDGKTYLVSGVETNRPLLNVSERYTGSFGLLVREVLPSKDTE